jgi:hypothetical protein
MKYLALFLSLVPVVSASARMPKLVNYQRRLAVGLTVVPDGNYSVTISPYFWSQPCNGT